MESVGVGRSEQDISTLMLKARSLLKQLQGNLDLFVDEEESVYELILSNLSNDHIQVAGPELIYGKLFDKIGFNKIEEPMFRHLVITRLYNPGSKLKTIDYLRNYLGIHKDIQEVYRFLDKLNNRLKEQVEDISYAYTTTVLKGSPGVVFYDMTTLYFEASDEDDLRKTGFSKDGKHQCPQIFLGLLVGYGGNPIGYDIFEGNIFEGHTLIPVLEKFEKRFSLSKPIVIADSGLLSKSNIQLLEEKGTNTSLVVVQKTRLSVLRRRYYPCVYPMEIAQLLKRQKRNALSSHFRRNERIKTHITEAKGLRDWRRKSVRES